MAPSVATIREPAAGSPSRATSPRQVRGAAMAGRHRTPVNPAGQRRQGTFAVLQRGRLRPGPEPKRPGRRPRGTPHRRVRRRQPNPVREDCHLLKREPCMSPLPVTPVAPLAGLVLGTGNQSGRGARPHPAAAGKNAAVQELLEPSSPGPSCFNQRRRQTGPTVCRHQCPSAARWLGLGKH